MAKKKILICGASGFIGRNLFEALSKRPDLDVYGTYLGNSFMYHEAPFKLHRVDLTEKHLAQKVTRMFDCIINAAAVTDGSGAVASDPGKYITDNIRINTNLIEVAHDNHVPHFIFLSCSIIYPKDNNGLVKEAEVDVTKIHPKYTGAKLVKLAGEDLCDFYSSLGRTRFTIARHSNIYGPYDKFDTSRGHVFAATVTKVMTPESKNIVVWGNGSEKRDFIHISDFVRFCELAIDHNDPHGVFNVGSSHSVSVRELVDKINSISGKNLPVILDTARPTINTDIILDTSKAKQVFGWQPQVDIDEGIRQTIGWYLKNKGEQIGK